MANPALVQSISRNSPTPRPSIALPAAVAAGHLLVLAMVDQAVYPLGLPSDQLGDVWASSTTGVEAGKYMSYGIFYLWNAKAGAPSVVVPSRAGCAYALHEFSGVQSTSDPLDDNGSASTTATSLSVSYAVAQRGELLFGMICSGQDITFALPASVTAAEAQSSVNGSLATLWSVSTGPQAGTLVWTTPQAAQMAGQYAAFL